eukprot:359198-Chlamydomonas_euryale.AAC.3
MTCAKGVTDDMRPMRPMTCSPSPVVHPMGRHAPKLSLTCCASHGQTCDDWAGLTMPEHRGGRG